MAQTFLLTALHYLREFVEVAVLGFFFAGVINAVVNKEAVARHLGGHPIVSNALAATLGFVTPLCCCSAIPTALTLYRAGSRRGPACAFLIAVPWFNWYGLIALAVFLGWRSAGIVAGSGVAVGFLAGLLIDTFGNRTPIANEAKYCSEEACSDASCRGPSNQTSVRGDRLFDLSDPRGKLREGVAFAFDLVRELSPWMLAGVLLGSATETFLPERWLTGHLGGASLAGLFAALALAGLFYTDSLGSLPWVRSLLDKGLGVGSGMVLLVAGVGTNLSTLGPVAQTMGMRTAVVYASAVALLAAFLGYALNIFAG